MYWRKKRLRGIKRERRMCMLGDGRVKRKKKTDGTLYSQPVQWTICAGPDKLVGNE